MKTTMKILASGLMVLALTITSCSKDSVTGDIGPIGPKGEQGIQGEKGPIGEPGVDGAAQGIPGEKGDTGATGAQGEPGIIGTDGQDGAQGPAGADGADGNANVRTFKYNISTESGSSIYREIPELTREVIENDLILGYLFVNDGRVATIPTPFRTGSGSFINILTDLGGNLTGGYYSVLFRSSDGLSNYEARAGEFLELKIIIAKSTSITTGKSNSQDIITKLESDGVDFNNYYEVMDYFELEY